MKRRLKYGDIVLRHTINVVYTGLYVKQNVDEGKIAYRVIDSRHSEVDLYDLIVLFPEDTLYEIPLVHKNVPEKALIDPTADELLEIQRKLASRQLGII